jgi:hypothetical protein
MKDAIGNNVKVGDRVAFAERTGQKARLLFGEVTEINVAIYPNNPDKLSAEVRQGSRKVLKGTTDIVVCGKAKP